MIIELGHFCLILALLAAIVQTSMRTLVVRAAIAQFVLAALAFLTLIYAYVVTDLSVLNVAENSNSMKPLLYKLTGPWSNHEGSMLLWISMLAFFGVLIAFDPRIWPSMKAPVLRVQGLLGMGFITFTLLTSNPFTRLFPAPIDGQDMNPLLQDPGLAFHPPLLYTGYVGFSIVFSFGVAALWTGRLDKRWASWVKPWVLLAWSALSAGIALGSWWAYYELGWGGWWFWDPVENASLMPWIMGTALLHSVIVLERRSALRRWTALLTILTFSLSILGTFLVRSGILTSVHAFAVDPKRGIFVLLMLGFYTGGALILYALRAHTLKGNSVFAPISRESAILLNNLFLVTAAATVVIGTLYPLLLNALNMGQISVGPPYFNYTFIPLMVPLLIIMAIGPYVPWKKGDISAIRQRLFAAAYATLVLAILAWGISGGKQLGALFGFIIGAWLVSATIIWWAQRVRIWQDGAWERIKALSLSHYGMVFAHAGLGLAVIGMVGTNLWVQKQLVVMHPGDHLKIGVYQLHFEGTEAAFGENYTALRGIFEARRHGGKPIPLYPEKRHYPVANQNTTEAAIHKSFWDDIYIALGQPENGGWVVRAYVHPLVPFMWNGFFFVALGGLFSFAGVWQKKRTQDNTPAPAEKALIEKTEEPEKPKTKTAATNKSGSASKTNKAPAKKAAPKKAAPKKTDTKSAAKTVATKTKTTGAKKPAKPAAKKSALKNAKKGTDRS